MAEPFAELSCVEDAQGRVWGLGGFAPRGFEGVSGEWVIKMMVVEWRRSVRVDLMSDQWITTVYLYGIQSATLRTSEAPA